MTSGPSRRGQALRWTMAFVFAIAAAGTASAQLSGGSPGSSSNGCSTGNNADHSCTFATQTLVNTGTQLKTRYAWNINADIGIFSTSDMAGTAAHRVSVNATAPGGYRLQIDTQRTGDMRRIDDALGCDGAADIGGVTGTSNVALSSGSLSLADPGGIGNGGSAVDLPFDQTSSGTIFRVSNGVSQSHSFTFTWSGSVRSNSCEAAVRVGASNGTTTGCDACVYPGNPSRTQSSDGHFVTITYTSLCGNGVIDGSVGEQCDQGSANGAFGSCCASTCQFKSNGTACSDDGNTCTNDVCNGASVTCTHPNNTAPCNDGFFCNGTDTCSGGSCSVHTGNPCPGADGDGNCSESCNEAADSCTAPDPNGSPCTDGLFCNGTDTCSGGACSAHTGNPCTGGAECNNVCNESADNCLAPNGFGCSSDSNPCSLDVCNGAGSCTHPAGNAGATCRASAGLCDVAETCTGASTTCPGDGFATGGTQCRAAAGDCDVAETCTGSGPACPADVLVTAGTECRAQTGPCDLAEQCNGVDASCPIDSVAGAFVTCRPAADDCDEPEQCDGVVKTCPADGYLPAGTECRAVAGDCDVAETCTGGSAACPADGFVTGGTECRGIAGPCDVAESCTGSSAACPADGFVTGGTECRAAAGDCDAAESCTGSSAACPADLPAPDGTSCDDGSACTSGETCTSGVCGGGSGVVCSLCETCDTGGGCVAVPRTDCRVSTQPLRSKLLIKDTPVDSIDKVIWKWIKGEATATADFGDPLVADDYAFCLYDQSGLVMEADAPAGGTCGTKPCWKALSGKGYKYVDKEGTPDGIQKLLLKAGGAGLSKVILKGKGANLQMPALPLSLTVTAQVRGGNGECWTTIHTPLGTTRNDSEQFKSKDGSPGGAFID